MIKILLVILMAITPLSCVTHDASNAQIDKNDRTVNLDTTLTQTIEVTVKDGRNRDRRIIVSLVPSDPVKKILTESEIVRMVNQVSFKVMPLLIDKNEYIPQSAEITVSEGTFASRVSFTTVDYDKTIVKNSYGIYFYFDKDD